MRYEQLSLDESQYQSSAFNSFLVAFETVQALPDVIQVDADVTVASIECLVEQIAEMLALSTPWRTSSSK